MRQLNVSYDGSCSMRAQMDGGRLTRSTASSHVALSSDRFELSTTMRSALELALLSVCVGAMLMQSSRMQFCLPVRVMVIE